MTNTEAEYLGHVIQLTIESEISKEAIILRDMERARQGVKNHLEGPNSDIDQIIRSIRENRWTLSNKLIKTFPHLADPDMAASVIGAVKQALGAEGDEQETSGHQNDGDAPD